MVIIDEAIHIRPTPPFEESMTHDALRKTTPIEREHITVLYQFKPRKHLAGYAKSPEYEPDLLNPSLSWVVQTVKSILNLSPLIVAEATPKSFMRAMGIPGLTLYHLKSHLQRYRLRKSQQSLESCAAGSSSNDDDGNKKEVELEEDKEIQSTRQHLAHAASSESSGRKEEEKLVKYENCLMIQEKRSQVSTALSIMNIHQDEVPHSNCLRKRNYDIILNESNSNKLRKSESSIDLNTKYQDDLDPGPKAINLNCHCQGAEQCSDGHL
ncbi:hypothetical protein SAY87_013334 [Trapa incisa]|uniref:Uncharacterized protein n=1 Tax=Trapa incisa TaxID=236973 RepID=A0AAN7KGZ1_9MYRT|nr:hypothetical protein SAY87_013334 [Trapa incisa]